jgi:hypothetical protein
MFSGALRVFDMEAFATWVLQPSPHGRVYGVLQIEYLEAL